MIPASSGPNGIPADVREEMSPSHQHDKFPVIKVLPSPIAVAADMARSMKKEIVSPKPDSTEVKEEDFSKTHNKVKNMIEQSK